MVFNEQAQSTCGSFVEISKFSWKQIIEDEIMFTHGHLEHISCMII